MAGLHVPLPTLRDQPYDWPRMARGRDGSLLLSRTTLSFATPRRLIPALPGSPDPYELCVAALRSPDPYLLCVAALRSANALHRGYLSSLFEPQVGDEIVVDGEHRAVVEHELVVQP